MNEGSLRIEPVSKSNLCKAFGMYGGVQGRTRSFRPPIKVNIIHLIRSYEGRKWGTNKNLEKYLKKSLKIFIVDLLRYS